MAKSDIRKDLPKKEIVWVRQFTLCGDEYVVTSQPERTVYNLYQVLPEGYQYLGKNKSPPALYEIVESRDTGLPDVKKAKRR